MLFYDGSILSNEETNLIYCNFYISCFFGLLIIFLIRGGPLAGGDWIECLD